VLSAMLQSADAVTLAAETVDASMFYVDRHRRIFAEIVSLAERGVVVDPLTVASQLDSRGELEECGGKDYIGYLLDVVPTTAHVADHAQIVRDKAAVRAVIALGTETARAAFAGEASVDELLKRAEAGIFAVNHQMRGSDAVAVKELLVPAMERIKALQCDNGAVAGTPSGFPTLDDMTCGFQPGDLVVLAARPSMGKTALALNVAAHVAIEKNTPVAMFSLEMSKEALLQRLLCTEGGVDSQRLRRGMLVDDEFRLLTRAAGLLSSAPIFIDDSSALSVLSVRQRAKQLRTREKLGLIIVDYLQLMTGRGENRTQEVTEISSGLKQMARELHVPVLALSQLSRKTEQRSKDDRRPQLSDLRESGAIEQDADMVLFIYRPELYEGPVDKDGRSLEGVAEIIVSKQRNGPTGTVKLQFVKQCTRFREMKV